MEAATKSERSLSGLHVARDSKPPRKIGTSMAEQNGGLEWRLRAIEEDLKDLKTEKAPTLLVDGLIRSVNELKEEVKSQRLEFKAEVSGLRTVLITAAVSWALGSGAFLLGVLELTK